MSNEEPPIDTNYLRDMRDELRAYGFRQNQMFAVLTKDPLDPHAAPGLMQIQEDQGRRLDDVKFRVTNLEVQHESNLEKINNAKEAQDVLRKERSWLMLYDAFKAIATGLIGAVTGAVSAVFAMKIMHH